MVRLCRSRGRGHSREDPQVAPDHRRHRAAAPTAGVGTKSRGPAGRLLDGWHHTVRGVFALRSGRKEQHVDGHKERRPDGRPAIERSISHCSHSSPWPSRSADSSPHRRGPQPLPRSRSSSSSARSKAAPPKYIEHAAAYAAQARAYGAAVTEVYSPRATWTRVEGCRGRRQHLHLPRPRERVSQSLRRVLVPSQERHGPQQLVATTATRTSSIGASTTCGPGSIWPATPSSCSTTCATHRATPSPAGRCRPSRSRCSEPTATAPASCGPAPRRSSRPATAA